MFAFYIKNKIYTFKSCVNFVIGSVKNGDIRKNPTDSISTIKSISIRIPHISDYNVKPFKF